MRKKKEKEEDRGLKGIDGCHSLCQTFLLYFFSKERRRVRRGEEEGKKKGKGKGMKKGGRGKRKWKDRSP